MGVAAPPRLTMTDWATCCALAPSEPRRAAEKFLAVATPEAVRRLMEAALWSDADVASFEATGRPARIAGDFGIFWLAPRGWAGALLPPAPRVAPADLVALARATVKLLAA